MFMVNDLYTKITSPNIQNTLNKTKWSNRLDTNDYDNLNKFLGDFNELDKVIKKKLNSTKGEFGPKFEQFINKNPGYKTLKEDVDFIRIIRNLIPHNWEKYGSPFIPTSGLCTKLERILINIKNPPKWSSIAIKTKQIYYCEDDDLISEVVKKMAENTFTHVPVLKSGEFQWLLSESIYVQWLSDVIGKNGRLPLGTKVSQLKKYINRTNDEYLILSEKTNVYEIKEEFRQYIRKRNSTSFKRLGVIFITKNGKKTEKIKGLITAWDLGKIKNI